jgi:hypothetical protein
VKLPELDRSEDSLNGFENLFASVKAELNFLRLPYFVTCKDAQKRFTELIETVNRDGIQKQIKWQVNANPKLGLPGRVERDIMFWVLYKADESRSTPNNPVLDWFDIGSIYSICRELNIPDDGKNIRRIKSAIEKLATTLCISKGAFYNKATKSYVESGDSFSFLCRWGFRGEPDGKGGVLESNYVGLHPWVKQNLDVFYVKTLDWSLLRSLKTEIAALLYPHLSCVFHGQRNNQEYIELGYKWLAQRLGIKVWIDIREAKKQLKLAHRELIENGYLSNVAWINDSIRYFPGIRASVEVARQKKRKRSASPSQNSGRQLIIPTLESLKHETDSKATEIARQAARLKLGKPLTQPRLEMFNIAPEEVHAFANLEISSQ